MTTSSRDRPQGPASKVLARSARDLFTPYPRALLGEAESVHRLRVAVRRLRVALALLAPNPRAKRRRRADRLLRRIARAVSSTRDFDVSAALFERFAPGRERDRPAWEGLRRSLAATRSRARRPSRERLLDLDLASLRDDLRAIAARDAATVEAFRTRFAALVETEGATLLETLRLVGRRFHPEALHEVRRRSRRMRYAAELADVLLTLDSGAPKIWRSFQSLIGKIHDRHVFAVWLGERERQASRSGDASRGRTARSMRVRVLRDARRLHRELLAADPVALASGALRAMRPQEGSTPAGAAVLDFPGQRAGVSP
jgi:CHAD domain-containing protein